MDSAVRIEPRFENPDGGSRLDAANGPSPQGVPPQLPAATTTTASAGSSINTWLYQNCYLVGGCFLIVVVFICLALWFRKPAEPTRLPPAHHPASNLGAPPGQSAVLAQQSTGQAVADPQSGVASQPPAQPAVQAPQQSPAQSAAQPPATQPPAQAPTTPAPQLTQQDLQDKLKAVWAARQQAERQPVAEVSDGDLDALMENPEKKPESQDLAISSYI